MVTKKKPLGTVARITALEKDVDKVQAILAAQAVLQGRLALGEPVKPVPGINLGKFNLERYSQIHGIGPGNELATYKYYTDPASADNTTLQKNQDFLLWKAARRANAVADSPDGLFILLYLAGENYPEADKVLGPEDGPVFTAWLQTYRGVR